MQLLTRTLRYLAQRFLADSDRPDRGESNQSTARTNAAEASATLRERRSDYDDVQEYLLTQRQSQAARRPKTGQDDDASEHAV